jgi:hypothetical protein
MSAEANPPQDAVGLYANNSFYTGMHLLSGLCFGATEYCYLMARAFRLDVIAFLILTFIPFLYLLAKRSMLNSERRKKFALARPYRHIVADFLFATSTVSIFSLLAFTITKGLPLIDINFDLSPNLLLIMFNATTFALSMFLYSLLAKTERAANA